jgi:hypothetical protein
MAEPTDLIVPMLPQLRFSIEALDGKVDSRADAIEARLKSLEEHNKAVQNAQTAETLFGKLVTGEFEDRIKALELKVRELEGAK